ncbi:MAG TPA: class IV adenylate cyclase, partial [Saprospiraceae bacterium]|nr:class IV adenylate cyclase [Saprospiraceae bacterium]
MNILNHEFKARITELKPYEDLLKDKNPHFQGVDHQKDTYFNVPNGRLKLREGNIENALIQYDREDIAGSKLSKIILYKHSPDPALKEILTMQLGIKVIVDKVRKIYFIGNVKFHFDAIVGLGYFLEVEAIDTQGTFTTLELQKQCDAYLDFFGLSANDLVQSSY